MTLVSQPRAHECPSTGHTPVTVSTQRKKDVAHDLLGGSHWQMLNHCALPTAASQSSKHSRLSAACTAVHMYVPDESCLRSVGQFRDNDPHQATGSPVSRVCDHTLKTSQRRTSCCAFLSASLPCFNAAITLACCFVSSMLDSCGHRQQRRENAQQNRAIEQRHQQAGLTSL